MSPKSAVRAVQLESTIEAHGSLRLDRLPFSAGERVEVIVLSRPTRNQTANRYPLRGETLRYERPTDPVDEEEWEALR